MYTNYTYKDYSTALSTKNLGSYVIKYMYGNIEEKKKVSFLSNKTEQYEESNYNICKEGNCADIQSIYYEKIKTTTINFNDRDRTIQSVTAKKIYGRLEFDNKDSSSFELDFFSKSGADGIIKYYNNTIIIRPINKNTSYGKMPNVVGIEFVKDNIIIGSFIQFNSALTVVLKNNLDEKTKLLLISISVALANYNEKA